MTRMAEKKAPPETDVVPVEQAELIREALVRVGKGLMTVEELLTALAADRLEVEEVTPKVPAVPPITKEQKAALKRIVAVYGKVAPAERTDLSAAQIEALADERTVIETVIKFLAMRKNDSIRETVSNHFDVVVEQQAKETDTEQLPPRDAKGHYTVKQEVAALAHGKKFVRQVSSPAPWISDEMLLDLYEDGTLTRKQYLAMTCEPKVKRVFDPEKFVEAAIKDPALVFLLAEATVQPAASTSIYLRDL